MRTYEPTPAGIESCLCDQDLLPGTGLGECVVVRDGGGALRIVRADPVIAVSGRLLWDWHDGTPPDVRLECNRSFTHMRDIIRIDAPDQRVIYEITGWRDVGGADVYTARWPD